MIQIHAISGSLRRLSTNTELLRAAALVAAPEIQIHLEVGLGDLPHFNPDLEGCEPVSVLEFRARLRAADAVIVSSPEYAHGVPGSLKNALDWTVGSGEFSGKPVALFNASPRASLAQLSLAEIIKTMDAVLVSDADLALALLGRDLRANDIVAQSHMRAELQRALGALAEVVRTRQRERSD